MNGPYQQSREESLTLLRVVIARMSQHDAPFNPVSFAVWYEYLAGINPGLKQAMAQLDDGKTRLDAATMEQLYLQHVAEPDAESTARFTQGITRVMGDIAQSARSTGEHAQSFGRHLDAFSRQLQGGPPQQQDAVARDVAEQTGRLQQQMQSLERTLADSQTQISALQVEAQRSRIEAVTDALTGILNRKGFDLALAQAMAQRPAPGTGHFLLMFDIDHFKRVNDTYGHVVGDAVIEAVGGVFRQVVTAPGLSGARYGGEEFAIVMTNATQQAALQLAEMVRGLVKAVRVRQRGSQAAITSVSISSGVAARVPGDDAPAWVAAADRALYRSKEAGRDRVTCA